MNSFLKALQTEEARTENGMITNSTSLNACVDAFFQIGAMRGQDKDRLINLYSKAFNENPQLALKLLFWVRDIRGGAGERQIFKDILVYLAENHRKVLENNIEFVPEYGRWDDLLVLLDTRLAEVTLKVIWAGFNNKNTVQLVAKWMPRTGKYAGILRQAFGLTNREWRKGLVKGSNTVEQLMCAKKWSQIEYSKLPSLASARYQSAFNRNDSDRYEKYKDDLADGTAKINAGAVYPYDVLKSSNRGDQTVANAQWQALPNYLEGSNENVIPMIDVSGSMGCSAGDSDSITCMDVAVSLGLYLSERIEGAFKDHFITFSGKPKLQKVNGPLSDRLKQIYKADWSMNTNIKAVFEMILNQAVKHNVPAKDMPTMILILSDMEFDQAQGNGVFSVWRKTNAETWDPTAQQMIEDLYSKTKYEVPKIVYWNIKSRGDNVPVQADTKNTGLVSGFSPAIMKSVLAGEDYTPEGIMKTTLLSERYEPIK